MRIVSFFLFFPFFFFLWEEGDGNISGDDSPLFCDSGAERVFFTLSSPLELAYKTRNAEMMEKKRGEDWMLGSIRDERWWWWRRRVHG